ncbi:unnamed protein product [Microthlaspi erraticum]|uniref:F-box domain-containing protein n=1 Tax=Microthlaspi erraticum TaxID=1685480 RepID=A0A6D2L7X7_9BRAS|nr:unnamed protein product [Microthlaspi erraticum]
MDFWIPEDILINIIARVPICYYPTISLVSKRFRSLVASPEIYTARSLLGCTEHCLYALLYSVNTKDYRWYVLHRKANGSHRLVLIPSIPPMSYSYEGSFVAIGSKIYVLGARYGDSSTSSEHVIDCRSHMVKPIISIPMQMYPAVPSVIDKKVYVIGVCRSSSPHSKMVMVFDTETQMWEEPVMMTTQDLEKLDLGYVSSRFVVIGDKVYMKSYKYSFVYEPKEDKLEIDEMLNFKRWEHACVVDEVLYYFDYGKNKLRAYETRHKCWVVVKGLEELLDDAGPSWWSRTVSYGGNVAVFLHKRKYRDETTEIRCVEIALERRQQGEIWGKVEWCEVVLEGAFTLMKSVAVII